jgi:hypothetical protein
MADRVWQEFYCGECDGYFDVKLNMGLNYEVEVVCPNCEHKHRRCIKDGQIFESGRYNSAIKEEIISTKAAYHKKPRTKAMNNASKDSRWSGRRDGVVITDPSRDFLKASWYEKFSGRS